MKELVKLAVEKASGSGLRWLQGQKHTDLGFADNTAGYCKSGVV